jgi:hypothetical protein
MKLLRLAFWLTIGAPIFILACFGWLMSSVIGCIVDHTMDALEALAAFPREE